MRKAFRIALVVTLLFATMGVLTVGKVGAAPAKIRIFVGLGAGTRTDDKAKQDAIAKLWNDANADLQISFDVVTGDAYAQLKKQLLSSDPPDIVGPIGIGDIYANPSFWTDLAPYIRKDKAELNLQDYNAATLQLFKLAGGKVTALPFDFYPSVLFVNEDRFRAAEVPLPPREWGAPYTDRDGHVVAWDWDTLAKVAQAVTVDQGGKYGDEAGFDPNTIVDYGFGNAGVDVRSFVSAWGPKDAGVAADNRTATFNQAAYLNAFSWLNVGIFQQHFAPDPAGWQALDAFNIVSPFATSKIAMWYSQAQVLCCLQNATFKWNVYAGPAVRGTAGKQISAPLHVDAFVMTAQSRDQIGAWSVLKWLNSAEIASQLCAIYACMPARQGIRAEWEKAVTTEFPNFDVKVVEDAVAYLDSPNHEGPLPNAQQALATLQNYYLQIQRDPKIDVAKGLNATNRVIQDIYHGKFPATTTPTPVLAAAAVTGQ